MNELALFAGAGGGILGGYLLGWKTVAAVEIEEYPRAVLLQRQLDGVLPKFPIWDDIRTFDGRQFRGKVDIITGGFPCQDISISGTGRGLDGNRSGLWSEMFRIICEVRPRFVFVENSPMLTIRGLGIVLANLSEVGYNAKWCTIGADAVGLPHKRARFWMVAYSSGEQWQCLDKSSQKRRSMLHIKSIDQKFRSSDLPFSVGKFNNNPVSRIHRNDYGLDSGMDRLKAIGNGQVPSVVRLAWEVLTQ